MNAASMQNTWLTTLTQALGWTLLHFVWQGALIALVLFLFVRLTRHRAPQLRYLAGCAALALMCGAAFATLTAETQAVRQELADSANRVAVTVPIAEQSTPRSQASAPELHATTGPNVRVRTNVVTSTASTANADSRAGKPKHCDRLVLAQMRSRSKWKAWRSVSSLICLGLFVYGHLVLSSFHSGCWPAGTLFATCASRPMRPTSSGSTGFTASRRGWAFRIRCGWCSQLRPESRW